MVDEEVLNVTTISPGDKLPCHLNRILHIKKRGDKVDDSLKIWFVSSEVD